jgi:hypothetical protein
MKRIFNAILLMFSQEKTQHSAFLVREDKECGGYIASTKVEPIVRATGDTEREALENLVNDLKEIQRVTDESGDPYSVKSKQYARA